MSDAGSILEEVVINFCVLYQGTQLAFLPFRYLFSREGEQMRLTLRKLRTSVICRCVLNPGATVRYVGAHHEIPARKIRGSAQ